MKAIKLFSMAVAALMMAACSSNDDVIQQQTAQPQGKKMHFTATIAAPNSGATTRTTYTEDGTTINVAWKEGDQIALIHGGVMDVVTVGTPNGDGSAPISGTITVGTETDGEDVVLAYPAAAVYSAEPDPYGTFPFTPDPTCWDKAHTQDGTLEFIQNNIDFRMGSGKLAVSGDPATASLKANVSMPSMISIWKLTLQDNTSAALSATAVTVKADGELVARATSTAKSAYYLCMVPSFIPAGDLVIEATVGSDTYTYTKAGGVSLTAGKFYQSTVTLTKPAASKIVDLSSLSDDYEAQDGDVLTGTLDVTNYPVKISIANNATVTLNGVTINGENDNSYEWAGLTCSGNATIILKDGTTNIVKGFYEDYPGIDVPVGNTVTIQGSGSLTASSNGYGAGIGGGFGISCGNIEIQGGVITATGGDYAAGIGAGSGVTGVGTGESICGTITISGGTVTATGGEYAAGIGSGYAQTNPSTCGAISISGGTVRATAGALAPAAIGKGAVDTGESTCASVTITPDITSLTLTNTNSGVTGIVSDFINATAVNANTTPITTMLSTSVTDPAITGGMTSAGFATSYNGGTKTWTITK